MRNILLPLTDPELDRQALSISRELASRFAGHVTAVLAPLDHACLSIYADYPSAPGWTELVEQARHVAEAREAHARRQFEEVQQNAESLGTVGTSLTLRVMAGSDEEVVVRSALTHDLVLVHRRRRDDVPSLASDPLLSHTVKECGRPVLLVTDQLPRDFARVVVVAWNGSMEAARAVTAALPLLQKAERVVILAFRTCRTQVSLSEDLRLYLERHDVRADVQESECEGFVGTDLLQAAEALPADLLVMGAFTRSRVGETAYGTVTGHVIENSSVPVLMAR